MDLFLAEFGVLREKDEARMAMWSGFPDEFVSIFCMQNAPLPKSGESLAMARIRSTLASPVVAIQMRRLFGQRGNAARQDVLLAAEADTDS